MIMLIAMQQAEIFIIPEVRPFSGIYFSENQRNAPPGRIAKEKTTAYLMIYAKAKKNEQMNFLKEENISKRTEVLSSFPSAKEK